MNYIEALEYIHSVDRFGMNLELDRIKELLKRIGNPQDNLKFIHIAGTNGKGSVTSFISQGLISSGYKVGMYTSPFLERFNERIRINGEEIEDNKLSEVVEFIKNACDSMLKDGFDHPTEFEIVTSVAFYYYNAEGCDFVCLEVGLGGRCDATNVIESSLVSVITSISMDHMGILGNTISEIAYEKAGIIKNNGRVFLYNNGEVEVIDTVKKVCNERNAVLDIVDFDNLEISKSNLANQVFTFKDYKGNLHIDIKIRMAGLHQVKNAIMAFNVLLFLGSELGYKIEEDMIKKGLLDTRWAGRFEVIKKSPLVIIDGAHNYDSATLLSNEVDRLIGDEYDKTLILGVLSDKEVDKIVKLLVPKFDRVIVTLPDSKRAMDVCELGYRVGMYCDDLICIEDPIEACKYAIELDINNDNESNRTSNNKKANKNKKYIKDKNTKKNKKKKCIVSCGSLYLVGIVRGVFK